MGKNTKMVDADSSYDIEVYKDALIEENISIQVDAVKRLPALAASMDVQRTRDELIPCLINCVDAMSEETCFNLAEQLELLVPFVGGNDHVGILLDILVKLACEDETLVRNRAVEAMKSICNGLNKEQCEASFYPLIEKLITSEWFTTKCSTGCLIAICYAKMSPEKQAELRNYFRNLIQDDSPMVRRSVATSVVDLIPFLDIEEVKSEFIPIFDNLAQDEQDSVRTLAIDVGIAISKTLKDCEVYEFLLQTFKTLGNESSWRVRQAVARKIHELKTTEITRAEIITIYNQCVRDKESEVRVFAAQNVYNLMENLLEGFKRDLEDYQSIFEKFFEENIFPEMHLMLRDSSDEVRVALSTNILSLSGLLSNECFNTNVLPLIIDALENEEYMPFKENMLKNLNFLPQNVDITKSLTSIRDVFQNLLEKSQMHWRTRRNLLLALMHISKNSTSKFFDANLLVFYQFLLNDSIYAIRRTAPLILPLLVKRFGTKWAEGSLFPIFQPFVRDEKYLYRCITLFAIEELIAPTLNRDSNNDKGRYLGDFINITSRQAVETLLKISKLNQKLQEQFEGHDEEKTNDVIKDDLNFYAEDTLESLRKEHGMDIFSVKDEEIEESYLEGVLVMLVKDFVKAVKLLLEDPVENVQKRAKVTWELVRSFSSKVKNEVDQEWVQERLSGISEDDLKKIDEEIDLKLKEKEVEEEAEMIDCNIDGEDGTDGTEGTDDIVDAESNDNEVTLMDESEEEDKTESEPDR